MTAMSPQERAELAANRCRLRGKDGALCKRCRGNAQIARSELRPGEAAPFEAAKKFAAVTTCGCLIPSRGDCPNPRPADCYFVSDRPAPTDRAEIVRDLLAALKPFADAVYNDNGSMTITPCGIDEYAKAYFVEKRIRRSLASEVRQKEKEHGHRR